MKILVDIRVAAHSFPVSDSSKERRTVLRESLAVTRNLAEAFRHHRLKEQPRELWIDTIWFVQRNLEEHISQVQRMGDVHRNAFQVILCIGSTSDDSALAIDFQISELEDGSRLSSTESKARPHEDLPLGDANSPQSYDSQTWTSMHNLLRRPWFKRRWIRQQAKLWLIAAMRRWVGGYYAI